MTSADEFIYFEEKPTRRKTRVVVVCNRRSDDELGVIQWYGPWRQYCFFPHPLTIFNPTCMSRITREVVELQTGWRDDRD